MKTSSVQSNNILLLLILILGAVLRIFAADGDLWLDEIWSFERARTLQWPWDLVTQRVLDGHLSLYTYIISLIGEGSWSLLLRAPALIFGILSIIIFYALATRLVGVATKESLLATLLFALSYPMVLYASEARGYSAMIFFALVALTLQLDIIRKWNFTAAIFFWFSILFAAAFHLSFIPYYLVFLMLSLFLRQEMRYACLIHLIPVAAFSSFYFFVIKNLGQGTGPLQPRIDLIVDSISIAVGGPLTSPSSLPATVAALIVVLLITVIFLKQLHSYYQRRENGLLCIALIGLLLVPAIVIFALSPKVLLPRYFLLSMLLLQIVIAGFLLQVGQQSSFAKVISRILLLAMLLGNMYYDWQLLLYKRGHYRELIHAIAANSVSSKIVVAGDNSFRDLMMLNYYAAQIPARDFVYVPQEKVEQYHETPEWLLFQSLDAYAEVPSVKTLKQSSFRLFIESKSAALSGWNWFLYRRVDSE